MRNLQPFMKTDLQFFAESAAEPSDSEPDMSVQTTEPEQESNQEPSIEEQLQQLRIENEKLKRAQEKAATDASSWKKKYNETLTDTQKAAQEKAEKEAEREEQYQTLLKENSVTKLEKNFLKLGYPEEKAHEAAEAQYGNDTDTLFRIQQEVQQSLVKQAEAEWLKNRPPVNTGAGEGKEEDAFLKGFNSVGNGIYAKKE